MENAIVHMSGGSDVAASMHIHFRQNSVNYGGHSLVHLSQQCFADCIWILITEDDTCAPGVILRHDPNEEGPAAKFDDPKALTAATCECLLGVRDHPLTNIVAGVVAHAVLREGDTRPLIMCVSLTKTARRLNTSEERMEFVRVIRDEFITLILGHDTGRKGEE